MKSASDKRSRENQNTHFTFDNSFFFENRALKVNVEEYGTARQATDDNIMQRLRCLCWIQKATHTHTHTHAHTHTRARTHAHTHTMCNIYRVSMAAIVA